MPRPKPDGALRTLGISLASGAALALCLPKAGLCPLAWVCYAPLFFIWNEIRPGRAFLSGLEAGFGFHGLALYWIFSTCRFAGIAYPVSLLAWAALALFLALNWGLAAAAGSWLVRRLPRTASPLLWAAVWTAVAYAGERWTPRVCADFPAYTQYRYPSLLQIDSILGPHGLGFVIIACNAALADFYKRDPAHRAQKLANLAAAYFLAAGCWAWGKRELSRRAAFLAAAPTARVEILQPNIDQYQKWDADFVRDIWLDFADLLRRPSNRPASLIVWPEAAAPRAAREGEVLPEILAVSPKSGAAQVVGVVSEKHGLTYNSAFLIGPDGKFKSSYHKRELVPFGEHVPGPFLFLRRWIGILNELGDISAGDIRQPIWTTPLGKTAAAICYEMMFPRLIREDASRGAQAVVNLTNDGWYKDSWGPYQHLEASRFRAVENRIYVVRAANTGISAVFDPWGEILSQIALNARLRLDTDVPTRDPFPWRSFYARHGDWLGKLCLLACVALALVLPPLSPSQRRFG